MRNKPLSRVYRTLNHEIHYMMSFIGGCLEIVSFMYLYKALIGYMTSNMIFGIAALANGGMDFESVYHISIILIWMVLAALHQLLVNRYHSRLHSPWHGYAIAMSINCLLLLAFMLAGGGDESLWAAGGQADAAGDAAGDHRADLHVYPELCD